MKLIVAHGYILVKPVKQNENITSSGIIVGTSVNQVPQKGQIIGMGDYLSTKGEKIEVSYKERDIIIFRKWEALEFKESIESEKLLFIKHSDVLGIMSKDILATIPEECK